MSNVQVSGPSDNNNEEINVEENVQQEPKKRGPKPKAKPEPEVLTLGRIVRYVTQQGTVRPAIVTAVHGDGEVDLTVFNSQGAAPVVDVPPAPEDELIEHTFHFPSK